MGRIGIEAKRSDVFLVDPEKLFLVTEEGHPLYDPRINLPVEESLVKNIMYQGVIEPVVVTKDGDKVAVVAGRQRVRATLEANKRLDEMGKEPVQVPCIVRRGDESALFGVSVSENENRTDDSPLAKAEKLQRYLNMGKTEEEAAIVFGVTSVTVRNWQKLLELSAKVKKAVDSRTISAHAAVQFHGLEKKEQDEKLEELLASGKKPTGDRARSVAKGEKKTAREVKKAFRKKMLKMIERFGLESFEKLVEEVKEEFEKNRTDPE